MSLKGETVGTEKYKMSESTKVQEDDMKKSSITSPLSQVASSLAPSLKKYEECFLPENKMDSKFSKLQDDYEHNLVTSADKIVNEELTVPFFYAKKNILVSGATGFIGKVLIEKLLRCCPDIECIYCLIRPKKDQTIEARLHELTQNKVRKTFKILEFF